MADRQLVDFSGDKVSFAPAAIAAADRRLDDS